MEAEAAEMLEFMNMAILEVNARRRVELISETMRDARRRGRHAENDLATTSPRCADERMRAPHADRQVAGCRNGPLAEL